MEPGLRKLLVSPIHGCHISHEYAFVGITCPYLALRNHGIQTGHYLVRYELFRAILRMLFTPKVPLSKLIMLGLPLN